MTGIEHERGAELGEPGRGLRLVGPDREQHRRQPVRERRERDPRAALRDDRAAPGQQLGLRDPALHADVGRLWTELGRVDLPARRHHDRHAELAQAGERTRTSRSPDSALNTVPSVR